MKVNAIEVCIDELQVACEYWDMAHFTTTPLVIIRKRSFGNVMEPSILASE
jgi:hypothetical protein